LRSVDLEKEIAQPDRTEGVSFARARPVQLPFVDEKKVLDVVVEHLEDDRRLPASFDVIPDDRVELARIEIARVQKHEPIRYLQPGHRFDLSGPRIISLRRESA
jgi:hypothetical protein